MRDEHSSRLIRKTNAIVNRLAEIDPQDDSVQALASNVKEGLSQDLRDQGRFAEAIALQREVVALRRAPLTAERRSSTLGNVAFSLAILGIIARDAGDRTLACASYTEAADLFGETEERGEILGFQQAMLDGLREKRTACATGGSIEGPLRASG
jgi:serine/threonine-protein kinase